MAYEFPNTPTNGQTNGAFQYDSSITAWRAQGSTNNVGTQIAQLQTASPIAVASAAARDALYPAPVQGQSVFRTDLGVTQTYYGLYNVSTNPGGRDTAGWYNTEKTQGLVPIRPTAVTFVSGSGSVNSMGQLQFSGITKIEIDGVFSADYQNYIIMLDAQAGSTNGVWIKYRAGGVDNTNTNNYNTGFSTVPGSLGPWNANGTTYANPGVINSGSSILKFEVQRPFENGIPTTMFGINVVDNGNGTRFDQTGCMFTLGNSWTGFSVLPANGSTTYTGNLSIYGMAK